jgi:hypothetical protein
MTMEFLYRSATPAYKGSHTQPAQSTGPLAGLGAVLGGGGATPAYQTVAGASAQAPAPARSWWQAFTVTPSYKTAEPCAADHVAPGEPSPDGEDGDAGPEGECDDPGLQVVIL